MINPTTLLPPVDLARRGLDVATYLMQAGPVFAKGDTVGISEAERIRVDLGHAPNSEEPAFVLTLEKTT